MSLNLLFLFFLGSVILFVSLEWNEMESNVKRFAFLVPIQMTIHTCKLLVLRFFFISLHIKRRTMHYIVAENKI